MNSFGLARTTILYLLVSFNPFLIWKFFGLELELAILLFIFLIILVIAQLSTNSLKFGFHDLPPLLWLLIVAVPVDLGNINFLGFVFRFLLCFFFIKIYNFKSSEVLNVLVLIVFIQAFFSILQFILMKLGVQGSYIEIGYLNGFTIGGLSFAVSTSFFTTGDIFLARFQGWAWEPASFAYCALLIAIYSRDRIIKVISAFIILATHSLAGLISLFIFYILKYFPLTLSIFMFLITFIIIAFNIEDIFLLLEFSSLSVRMEQIYIFFESIDLNVLIFGSGFASDLTYQTAQTNILLKYILYFGIIRTLLAIGIMFYMFKCSHDSIYYRYYIFLIPILLFNFSLDMSFASISFLYFLAKYYENHKPKTI